MLMIKLSYVKSIRKTIIGSGFIASKFKKKLQVIKNIILLSMHRNFQLLRKKKKI